MAMRPSRAGKATNRASPVDAVSIVRPTGFSGSSGWKRLQDRRRGWVEIRILPGG